MAQTYSNSYMTDPNEIFKVIATNPILPSSSKDRRKESTSTPEGSPTIEKSFFKASIFGGTGICQLSSAYHENCWYDDRHCRRRPSEDDEEYDRPAVRRLREQSSTDSAFEEHDSSSPDDHLSELSRTDSIASRESDEQSDGLAELPDLKRNDRTGMPRNYDGSKIAFKQEASRSYSVDSGYSTISLVQNRTQRTESTEDEEDGPISLRKVAELSKSLKQKHEVSKIVDKVVDDLSERQVTHVKKFIRYNNWPVSHEIRAELWRVLCHNKDFEMHKALYSRQLDDLMKSGVKTLRPAFLSADGIVIHDHGLKETGAVALQRLLIVIECVRPEIRFVPVLYPLCAMFLHYLNPDETFACMMRLLSQGHSFLLQSEVAMYATKFTILGLVKKHKHNIYNLLKRRLGTSDERKLAEVFSGWADWIFKYLPFEYLVRVVDCFLVEGHKMLLRVAVSIVYIWYKEKGKENPSSRWNSKSIEERTADIAHQIVQIAQFIPISEQTLLDVACAIRNLKFSTIDRLQKHYEEKFRDEVSKRRAEREDSRRTRTPKRLYTAAFDSVIVDAESASELMCALPSRFQLETPVLMFRLSEHGASFTQLWSLIDESEQSLMIFRATNGRIFGAYCSTSWLERRDLRERSKSRYFGTGESFVFMVDTQLQLPIVYPWVGTNSDRPDNCPQMFMTAGDKYLIIGSGGGDAIVIRDELSNGLSYPCETFGSPALVPGNAFSIDEMEVWRVIGTV